MEPWDALRSLQESATESVSDPDEACPHPYNVIHPMFCLRTGPQSLHTLRSNASSFNFHHPLGSLRSSSSCLRLFILLPCLPITSSSPLPSVMFFRRQFLRKMWPIQLTFRLFILCRIFLSSLTLCNTSLFLTRSVQTDLLHFFPSTTFQNIPGISDRLSEVSKFQRHTMLGSSIALH